MELIKWRESYETGIRSMDTQHQKLIELINRLYKAIRKEESGELIEDVLNEMTKYAEMHLQKEEAILEANSYPDITNHIALHQSYLDKLNELMTESRKEEGLAVKDTYSFLRQWWMGHIVTEDKKYGEFLKSKGVE
jgi:hemerythrin-like metal-binding protein